MRRSFLFGVVVGITVLLALAISPLVESGGYNFFPGLRVTSPLGIISSGAVSAPAFDGGVFAGTTLALSGAAVMQSTLSVQTLDGGAIIGSTLNTAGANVLGGQSTLATVLITGATTAQNIISAPIFDGGALVGTTINTSGTARFGGDLTAQDAGINKLSARTEFTLLSLYTNAVNNTNTYGGTVIRQPFVVNEVCIYVSNVAGAGTNNILRITDGTNNCDSTFSCGSVLNTTGVKCATPTGTCSFATDSSLVISETTAGCTPDPTLKSVSILGLYQ